MCTLGSYRFWSESCREMPESQSTSPAGRSRTQNRSRGKGRARNRARGGRLPDTEKKVFSSSSLLPR